MHHDSDTNEEKSILFTTNAAKTALKVGTTTIYKFCKEGKLTPIKFCPRCTRFRLSEILALIDAHAIPASKAVSHE